MAAGAPGARGRSRQAACLPPHPATLYGDQRRAAGEMIISRSLDAGLRFETNSRMHDRAIIQ